MIICANCLPAVPSRLLLEKLDVEGLANGILGYQDKGRDWKHTRQGTFDAGPSGRHCGTSPQLDVYQQFHILSGGCLSNLRTVSSAYAPSLSPSVLTLFLQQLEPWNTRTELIVNPQYQDQAMKARTPWNKIGEYYAGTVLVDVGNRNSNVRLSPCFS